MKPKSNETRQKENKTSKVKSKTDGDTGKENEKNRQMLKESLLMPTTSVGKTTSASNCEKSNVWAEQRLSERKNDLDKKLYRNMVKLNSDRLQVVNELTKIKKSASTGHLDRLSKLQTRAHGSPRSPSDLKTKSGQNSPHIQRHLSDGDYIKTTKLITGRHGQNENSAKKHPVNISITVISDSSSDESEGTDESHKIEPGIRGYHNFRRGSCDLANHSDALHLTPCLGYRGFIEDRHQSHMVESVGRRYAKQLSAKARTDK